MILFAVAQIALHQPPPPATRAAPQPCYRGAGPVSPRLPLGVAACGSLASTTPVTPPAQTPHLPDATTTSAQQAPAFNINGVDVYLLPPQVIVRPAEVNVAAPEVHFLKPGETVPGVTPAGATAPIQVQDSAPAPADAPGTPEPR